MKLMKSTRRKFDVEIRLHESFDELGNSEALLALLRELEAPIDSTLKYWFGEHERMTAYCDSVRVGMHQVLRRCAEGVRTELPKAAATEILHAITTHPWADRVDGETDVETIEHFVEELKTSFAEQTRSFFPSGAGLEQIHAQLEREKFREWCFPPPPEGSRAERVY